MFVRLSVFRVVCRINRKAEQLFASIYEISDSKPHTGVQHLWSLTATLINKTPTTHQHRSIACLTDAVRCLPPKLRSCGKKPLNKPFTTVDKGKGTTKFAPSVGLRPNNCYLKLPPAVTLILTVMVCLSHTWWRLSTTMRFHAPSTLRFCPEYDSKLRRSMVPATWRMW